MTQQNINVGTGPDSYTGESLRTAFQKVNDNFSQLYAGNVGANISGNIITANGFVTSGNVVTGNATAAGNISAYYFIGDGSRLTGVTVSANSGNIAFSNLTISGSVAGNIVLDPAGDGNVSIVSDVIPGANVTYNLGSSTRQWKDLWLSNSTLYLGGFPVTVSNTGALSVNGSPVTSSYGNANVSTLLAAFGSNTIVTTGNISSGNISTGVITLTNGAVIKDTTGLAIGYQAGYTGQRQNAIAIGVQAGYTGQGNNAVAIGTFTGVSNQGNNSIIINATGSTVDQTTANTFTVAPVRNDVANVAQVVFYNTTSKEITYGNTISVAGNVTGNYILGNGSQLTGLPATYSNATVASYLPTYTGNIAGNIVKNGYSWTFGTTGNTTFPNGATFTGYDLYASANSYVELAGYTGNTYVGLDNNSAFIQTDWNGSQKQWSFLANGNLALPTGGVLLVSGGIAPVSLSTSPAPYLSGFSSINSQTMTATGNISSGNISTGVITLTNGAVIKDTAGDAVAIGQGAGTASQGNIAVAIGKDAGQTSQGGSAVAVGDAAGLTTQGAAAVAIGSGAGLTTQGINAVAIGVVAGQNSQGAGAVAIGNAAGYTGQGISSVAIGALAGTNTQGVNAIAIGLNAGKTNQGNIAVAIGLNAGSTTQGGSAVAIGDFAGNTSQGESSVAVGRIAGQISQGSSATAVGYGAGYSNQGLVAVAIGALAGATNQGNNSIIINATGSALDQTRADTFTVAPVRNDVSNVAQVVFYNTTSKEVTYGNTVNVAGNISGAALTSNASITAITTISALGGLQATPIGNVVGRASSGSFTTITANGNLTVSAVSINNSATVGTTLGVTGNVTGGNLITAGQVTATGNITASYFIGNGSLLTGLASSTYSNANVALYMTTYGGPINANIITGTANATINGLTVNTSGVFTTTLQAAGGLQNTPIGNVVGQASSGSFTTITANGNLTVSAVSINNSATIGTTLGVTGNATVGNLTTAGQVTATGNISASNFNVTGNIVDTGALTIITGSSGNVTLAPNGTTVLIATTTGIVGNVLAATTATAANNVGYLGMPQNATGTATLTIADAGRHIYVTSAGQTITIPANSSVAFPIGTAIAFIAGPSATTVSIAITTDTMYLAGTGTTGTRTLAAYGMATAVKVAATTWYINGSGLT